jgi:hypothetical protein
MSALPEAFRPAVTPDALKPLGVVMVTVPLRSR